MKSIKEIVGASNKDLKDNRINSALKNMASVSEQKIQAQIVEFRNDKMKFETILDMGDDTTLDIASNIRKIDPIEFTNKVYGEAEDLVIKARTIDIAVSIHNQLFPDNKVKGLDEDDIDGFVDAIYPTKH